jgi:hypothetical protein
VIEQAGGLELDYVDEEARKGYLLRMSKGCGDGSCSC